MIWITTSTTDFRPYYFLLFLFVDLTTRNKKIEKKYESGRIMESFLELNCGIFVVERFPISKLISVSGPMRSTHKKTNNL